MRLRRIRCRRRSWNQDAANPCRNLLTFTDHHGWTNRFGPGAGWLRRCCTGKFALPPDTECFRWPVQRLRTQLAIDCLRQWRTRAFQGVRLHALWHAERSHLRTRRLALETPRVVFKALRLQCKQSVIARVWRVQIENAAPIYNMRQHCMILPCLPWALRCVPEENCFVKRTAKRQELC